MKIGEGSRDVLKAINKTVSKIVRRVHFPAVTGSVVRREKDSVRDHVPHLRVAAF